MISDATDASGAQVQRSMKKTQESEEGSAEASPDTTAKEEGV